MHSVSALGIDVVHNAWRTAWLNFWNDTYGPMVTPQVTVNELVTDQLDPATGKNVAQRVNADHFVGTGAGKTVSPRDCLLLSFYTGVPTRAGRGRMYLPSPDSSHYLDTGQFANDVGTTVAGGWKAVIDANFPGDPGQVIYHRSTRTTTPVIGVKVGAVPATMRSRTNKVPNAYAGATY